MSDSYRDGCSKKGRVVLFLMSALLFVMDPLKRRGYR